MVRKKRSIFRAGYTAKYFGPLPLHVSSSVSSSRGEQSVGRMVLTLPRRPFTHPRTCQQVRRRALHPAWAPRAIPPVAVTISARYAIDQSMSCDPSMDVERSIAACHAIHQSMSSDPSVDVERSIPACQTCYPSGSSRPSPSPPKTPKPSATPSPPPPSPPSSTSPRSR
jgi:hypothetical protein